MWVDRWSEKELAPGVWLVRYMELHQPFVGEAGAKAICLRLAGWCAMLCQRALLLGQRCACGAWWVMRDAVPTNELCCWPACCLGHSGTTACSPDELLHSWQNCHPCGLQTPSVPLPHACHHAADEHTGAQRSGRWATAVLRQQAGNSYRIAYVHETYVPQESARA